tara:strand:- start:991 stop:1266 length:276 start_codon:yes stop_codon:yes gene_type:complete
MLNDVKKKLRFDNIVKVCLIPCRREILPIKDLLWWSDIDCLRFKTERDIEIKIVLSTYFYNKPKFIHESNLNLVKMATKKLYQLEEGKNLN